MMNKKVLNIQPPSHQPISPHPIFNFGFRIFFSAGSLFAIITMLIWMFIYTGKTSIDVTKINPFYWHGHEMLYGYAMAIVAGFLLTAVKTWTGVMMPYGYRLMGIFIFWAIARISWAFIGINIGSSSAWLLLAMLSDLIFMLLMIAAIANAVLKVKQYKQIGIVSKLLLLIIGNALSYYGFYKGDINYTRIGIYVGLYLIIGVVLTIGRRVVPFFIERGLSFDSKDEVKVKNSKLLDILSLISFFVFMLADIFFPKPYLISISAFTVFIVNFIRLVGWYNPRLWQKPLLWSLYMAFLGMCIGFLLFALQPWFNFSHSLAVHAIAISGIGMMTIAMMARVSLGHTGLNIHNPPKTVILMFWLMIIVFLFRVIMPIISLDQYLAWIMISQTAWIACFALFCVSYLPILSRPRKDGLFG